MVGVGVRLGVRIGVGGTYVLSAVPTCFPQRNPIKKRAIPARIKRINTDLIL